MRRRDFIASLSAFAALTPVARASQQTFKLGQQERSGEIPLDYTDARFNDNIASNALRVPAGGVVNDRSITRTDGTASIVTRNGATIRNCRVNSRECVRVGGGGSFLIDSCYLEALGVESDHADVIQAYSPGSRGTLKVSNTAIVTHDVAANAGLFIADNWTGTIELENVAFIGGGVNYGLRIHPDTGGDNILRLRNVYFIPPFRYAPYLLGDVGGHKNFIEYWEGVRLGRILEGKLVAGQVLPRPF
ncbi:hypothetical protein [Rhodopseudomonas sp. B29]|uniref:hypothetical protein n=1 Tax=Rhodopseudomonas sp. B29 TaxID=95607 RepID=UPI0011D27C9E|nr:hypothetical protein [Rhodopseudomonas sp. B29]